MTEPLTVITLSYGRIYHLIEAVQSFLKQDYTGEREMIVFNTLQAQILKGSFPNIRIVNHPVRPPSLGATRNAAVELAKEGWIFILDDDDIWLPGHLSHYAQHFDGHDWLWANRQFSARGRKIKEIAQGSCPLFAFRKSAWREVGGYVSRDCGEDRSFITRITQQFHNGKRIETGPLETTFIYSWDDGNYHLSGEGDDTPGRRSGHDRIGAWTEARVRNGQIPSGELEIVPRWNEDYFQQAAEFIERLHGSKKNECVIVQLGRFGDIINVLPIARHIAETYGKPKWMVSREFASVLEGVSYVEPLVVDLRNDQIKQAMSVARRDFRNVLQPQVWGLGYAAEQRCKSYNMESWRSVGFLHKFEDRTWAPYFDLRDRDREALLMTKISNGKPLMLVNLTSSNSSPFPQGEAVLEKVIERWGAGFNVIDMAALKLHRIYDVLGLMDEAVCVVSIDTALLHLAAASRVPVVALTNPKPWLGTVCRCNCVGNFNYDEALANFASVQTAIGEAVSQVRYAQATPNPVGQAPDRYIIHAVERHAEGDQSDLRRRGDAQHSWDRLYEQGVMPAHYWKYNRDATSIGDRRPLPFLKDVLQNAMNQGGNDDIIMLTNDDVHLHLDLPDLIRFHVPVYGPCCAQRCEYVGQRVVASAPPEVHARNGAIHMGRDLFAFTKSWLLAKWQEIPDFILGASDWDLCMACLIRLENGVISNRQNLEKAIPPSELPRGYVSHEAHSALWNAPDNVNKAASQKHNRKLFRKWASNYLPSLHFHEGNVI